MKPQSPVLPAAVLFFVLAAGTPLRAAEVFQVTSESKTALPRGKEADGMIGDWLIRNDKVVAVIGRTGDWRDANQMVEGVQGAVIDFTTVGRNNDELVVFYPMGYRPVGVSANRAEVTSAKGSSVSLAVIRDATIKEPYVTTTTYTLNDNESFLHVRTIHKNTSSNPVEVAAHDWLRLDNDIACRQSSGDQTCVVLENKWYHAAYGLAGADGRAQRANKGFAQKNLRSIGVLVHYPAVDPEQKATLTIEPGRTLVLERLLLVGRDTADVQAIAARAAARTPPRIKLTAREKEGGAPIAEVFVEIKRDGMYVTGATSAADGSFELPLDDGNYSLTAMQTGRPELQRTLVVRQGKASGDTVLALAPQSTVTIDITEAGGGQRMPVKLEFRNPKGKGGPDLGPPKRPNGANNLFFSARGQDTFPILPGDYAVHISRGPEYEVAIRTLRVSAGAHVQLSVALRHEFTTPQWILADLHNHATGSGDSSIELAGRVLNLAGSGIEFAPATEHNRISTFTPTIRALGLENFIASCPGMELSGRPGPGNTNHQIGFPLEIREDRQGYGAPRTDVDPLIQMTRLYELDHRSPKLMQQNHPDIPWLYFDKDRDGVVDGGFGTRPITDVMEIRESMLTVLTETDPATTRHHNRVFYWLQMLNQGDHILGTANTDAHSVGHQSGSIFNYVHLDHPDIATLDPWEIARAVKHGHVVMSNGPFMEVSISGALPGDTVTVAPDAVTVKIKVQQADWSRIDRVQLLVNGRQLATGSFTREKNPEKFGKGVVQFEQTVTVPLKQDAHIIVVAAGEHETIANRVGGKYADNMPMAMSNPIFVDIDGNGFQPNHDTLGVPLPAAKPGKDHAGENAD